MLSRTHKLNLSKPVIFALLACLAYWTYLACTSQMYIIYDSEGYEQLGRLLHNQGWKAYFVQGPNREPLYPWLISISMGLGSMLSVSYQSVQILFQLTILWITIFLIIKIMRMLKIHPIIMAFVILYFGFSPSITSTGFGLMSEIAPFPLICGLILTSHKLWNTMYSENRKNVILDSLSVATIFVLITLVKGIFQLIFLLYCIPFLFILVVFLKRKEMFLMINVAIILCTLMAGYVLPISGYMLLNKTYNGEFTLTDRGAWALYGNTARRMEPLNKKRIMSALAYIPGWGFCHAMYGEEACRFWSYQTSDDYGAKMRNILTDQYGSKEIVNKELVVKSIQQALGNPPQYIMLTVLEGFKMIFWDSLEAGFTVFPRPILKLFSVKWLSIVYFFTTAALTFSSLLYLLMITVKNRKIFLQKDNPKKEESVLLFQILFLTAIYIMSYTPFYIVYRYSSPLAPLYLISIAFMLDRLFLKLSSSLRN